MGSEICYAYFSCYFPLFQPCNAYARSYKLHVGARLARTSVVLTAPVIVGVHDEVTHPVWVWCVAQVPFWWCSSQPQQNRRPNFPETTGTCLYSGRKTCRPLGSTVADVLALLSRPPIPRQRMSPISAVCRTGFD